eukprot:CAMPEP_0197463494 /NCGR_PEP_ID=MMETSP1175-20131217/61960_1 /TAXON_ID=1003142 /ORGANISM="Triceratium dubium, Strain CCMP147" /LENGTH=35 /DNA_ID= /DNA_START= /DNA_END= /DNA_ORIENTATION=
MAAGRTPRRRRNGCNDRHGAMTTAASSAALRLGSA